MNRVNRTNWRKIFFLYFFVFCYEHPKWDQNPKFTPISETTSIPAPFIWEPPPSPALHFGIYTRRISSCTATGSRENRGPWEFCCWYKRIVVRNQNRVQCTWSWLHLSSNKSFSLGTLVKEEKKLKPPFTMAKERILYNSDTNYTTM